MSTLLRHPVARLVLLATLVALAYIKWLPFPWRQPLVALMAIAIVWIAREPLSAIGFVWPIPWRRTLAWALIGTLITCAFITPVIEPWLNRWTQTPADYSGYGALKDNLPLTLQLIGNAWLSAAFGEEVVFRGFLLHQADRVIGRSLPAQLLAVVLGAAVFGLSHHTQGTVGILLTGLTGLLMGVIFLASGRNVWTVILAHGLIDTWGVFSLYWNVY